MSKERETKHEKYNRHNRNNHIPGYTPSCRILICLLLWLSVLMPTLKEFVENVLAENNIQSDPDKIIEQITNIARNRAEKQDDVRCSCAVISDDEVRDMVINNADLANRLAAEKKEKKRKEEERTAELQKQKEQEKLEKELEKERKLADGEQTTLF